jgi:hypothetical protein
MDPANIFMALLCFFASKLDCHMSCLCHGVGLAKNIDVVCTSVYLDKSSATPTKVVFLDWRQKHTLRGQ